MLLKRFINTLDYLKLSLLLRAFVPTKLVMLVISVLWFSGCNSTPDKATSELEQLKNETQPLLTDNITRTNTAEKTIKNNNESNTLLAENSRISAKNLYEQQQLETPIAISDSVRKDYQQALVLMKNKQWQQANVAFDKVIAQQPELSGSYVNKAIIAKDQGDLTQAQEQLVIAITINELNLYAHHLQGQVYRLQGEFDKAEQSYLAALAIWPDFVEVHASMAVLLELYRGRLIDAYRYYDSYLALKPEDEEIQRWQAGLAIKIKRAGLTLPVKEAEVKAINNPESEARASTLTVQEGGNAQQEIPVKEQDEK